MKKLIIIAAALLAVNCWAGMPEELFKVTHTFDITVLDRDNTGDIFGATMDAEYFKTKTTEYFIAKENSVILKEWVATSDTSSCMAVMSSGTIYVICVEGKTVIIKEIK